MFIKYNLKINITYIFTNIWINICILIDILSKMDYKELWWRLLGRKFVGQARQDPMDRTAASTNFSFKKI